MTPLGDTGQVSTQITSGRGTHPESEVRGGRGGQRGGKRTQKVLEKWPFLVGQASDLSEGSSGTQRGRGKERKPGRKRQEEIVTPRSKDGRKK